MHSVPRPRPRPPATSSGAAMCSQYEHKLCACLRVFASADIKLKYAGGSDLVEGGKRANTHKKRTHSNSANSQRDFTCGSVRGIYVHVGAAYVPN